jgi:hypothetical protein
MAYNTAINRMEMLTVPHEMVDFEIANSGEDRRFRPTALVTARQQQSGRYLFVHSVKEPNPHVLWPVQGGLDGNPIEYTAVEEPYQETRVCVEPESIHVLDGLLHSTPPRDRYTAGKLLVSCVAQFRTNESRIKLNSDEVDEFLLLDLDNSRALLAANAKARPRSRFKALFAYRAILRAEELL